ncbi:MAG: peptidoglycan-binding protein [Clostridia bacterium]|nr:peptidoglycan-binding protein [Clostridia bacterium]
MGTMNGVTTSKVTAGKWTHWGELQGVDYAGAGDPGSGTAGNESQGSFLNGSSPMSRGDGTPVTQTLKRGSKGSAVAGLQTMLRKLGYDLGPCGIDGDFGKATEAAVRSFQSDHRLAADGVAGKNTWAELEKAVKAISVKPGEETYSVTIGGLDLTQAQALMNNYPGSVMEKE